MKSTFACRTLALGALLAPLAGSAVPPGFPVVMAEHVTGIFDVVLALTVGLVVALVSWVLGQRTRRRSEHQSEERVRQSTSLIEHADCVLWEAEVDLKTWAWDFTVHPSALSRRIMGEPVPLLRKRLWYGKYQVPEHDEMKLRAREALEQRLPGYEQEFRLVRDGVTLWMHERVSITPRGTSLFWLVGLVTERTALRKAEEAQRHSELTVERILSHADCLLWRATVILKDGELDWTHFDIPRSQLSEMLFGDRTYTHDKGFWDGLTVLEAVENNVRSSKAIREGATGYSQQFRVVTGSGRLIWLHERVSITQISPASWSLVGVLTDITAQRGAEEALAAEKERLSVTLRAMNESVITTDVGGLVQFMNPAAAALTGWSETEATGRPVEEICRLESRRTAQVRDLPVAEVARGDALADLPPDTRLVTRSGQHRQVEGCCAPIHALDSKVIGTVLVIRDVTEQERLEQELVRATRLESVGVLAGGIAHDFNNILTAVMGNLTLAQLDVDPAGPAAASLRSAEKAALRARDLTQQLLTFAKGGEPVRAAVQLEAVVREMTSFALHGSQVKAFFDLAPDLWPADADKGQIGRVVQNLVINAVQAMPGGGTLRIIARNDPLDGSGLPRLAPGSYIQIAITDTGEGIAPEHLTRIFDPYFTTKQTGTGLGLAAVYSIVKKHRGHVEVESQVAHGTTFRMWLPALRGEVVRVESRAPWDPDVLRGRVLFMDDEQIIRDMATMLLQRFGLSVECAADGAEAIEKYQAARARGQPYDVVIMDLTIPGGMGGLAAVGKLRTIDPHVKAIVSSGYSSDPIMANYREHGFAGMVAKPYDVDDFARVLRAVLPGS